MRAAFLVFLTAGLLVGCSSSRYDRYGRSYPASARVGTTDGGQARYAICHKGKRTMTLPESAVRGHLRHGDYFGRCGDRRNDRRGDRRGQRGSRDDDRDDRRERGRRGRGNGRGNNG